jgi:hypothetical protein
MPASLTWSPRAHSPIFLAPSCVSTVRAEAQSGVLKLVVFYLGVPDTTPEFATEDKLDASDRIGLHGLARQREQDAMTRMEFARLIDHSVPNRSDGTRC